MSIYVTSSSVKLLYTIRVIKKKIMPSSPIKKMNSQSKYPRQLLIVLLAIIILATF